MKVLGIVGSPRIHGNTETLVAAALASAANEGVQTELLTLAGKTITPCDGCRSCYKTGACHVQDDMQEVYRKLLEADGIIIGTPVYFLNVTSQVKAVMDRTWAIYHQKQLRNKAAAVVITKGRHGSSATTEALAAFFMLHKMIMVGRSAGIGGFDKSLINKDTTALADAAAVGRAVAKFVQMREIPE